MTKWELRACSIWPLLIASAVAFAILKVIFLRVDWAVVVCSVLLTVVAFQLRARKRKLLAAGA